MAEPEKSSACPKNAPQHVPEKQSGERIRLMKMWKPVGLILLGLAWLGLWTYMFFATEAAATRFDRRMAMIERRELQPQTLYVEEIIDVSRNRGNYGKWKLLLGGNWDERGTTRWDDNIDDLHVGTPVTVYRFSDAYSAGPVHDGYVIPRFDHSPREGKWAALVIGLLPVLALGGVLLFKTLRGRSVVRAH